MSHVTMNSLNKIEDSSWCHHFLRFDSSFSIILDMDDHHHKNKMMMWSVMHCGWSHIIVWWILLDCVFIFLMLSSFVSFDFILNYTSSIHLHYLVDCRFRFFDCPQMCEFSFCDDTCYAVHSHNVLLEKHELWLIVGFFCHRLSLTH